MEMCQVQATLTRLNLCSPSVVSVSLHVWQVLFHFSSSPPDPADVLHLVIYSVGGGGRGKAGKSHGDAELNANQTTEDSATSFTVKKDVEDLRKLGETCTDK
ncbi:hypothetical protein ATANTOWER_022413 [Ataeniobius toweri]|uniref:Uncharacterized protein n=1 Tax=Ataeniobius toweri TaxID=208326 RepID=A0ABU7C006_9TELE|nr:hypothetical protein [Ataeniobius toweri]